MLKQIQAGVLDINISAGEERLDELVGFASRENPKRGFLFVSKVLGKHIPVKPSVMRAIYDELADLCDIDSHTYVIGMAETATGLGAGVADSLAKKNPAFDLFYQHTTRHQLNQPVWFTLDEIHSHAVDHIFYRPHGDVYLGIQSCEKLILVDDEVTTGRTLLRLAENILKKTPSIKELVIVTLVSWLTREKTERFEDFPLPVKFIQLIKGSFSFTPDPEFIVRLPEHIDDGLCLDESREDLGRIGLKMPYKVANDQLLEKQDSNTAVTVVGSGEHLYYPFLLAEQLEKEMDVVFQSTTRSPILKGDAIQRKTSFKVANNKVNFIYNLPPERKMFLFCESEVSALKNGLFAGQQNEL